MIILFMNNNMKILTMKYFASQDINDDKMACEWLG